MIEWNVMLETDIALDGPSLWIIKHTPCAWLRPVFFSGTLLQLCFCKVTPAGAACLKAEPRREKNERWMALMVIKKQQRDKEMDNKRGDRMTSRKRSVWKWESPYVTLAIQRILQHSQIGQKCTVCKPYLSDFWFSLFFGILFVYWRVIGVMGVDGWWSSSRARFGVCSCPDLI